MFRGLIKIFIIVLMLYAIDAMLDNIYKTDIPWQHEFYGYTLKELNFCENGVFHILENKIVCEHKDIIISYQCIDGFCSKKVDVKILENKK